MTRIASLTEHVLISVNPNGLLRNSMMYGKTFLRLKNYSKAKEYLQKAVDFEPKRPEDEEVRMNNNLAVWAAFVICYDVIIVV